ncbi:MAG: hypothetical protein D6683_02075 [Actinomyces sp.]|nr:MAG: hypothetical protein D6683_02075 [Actinomyces sp.]
MSSRRVPSRPPSSPRRRRPEAIELAPPGVNLVVLRGTLSSPPRRRRLASGSSLDAYEVTTAEAVSRADDDGPAAVGRLSVPVVWFDARRPPRLAAGDEVVVVGRVRRRFYRAGGSTVSRTEVVADVVARAGTARAARSVARALAVFADDPGRPRPDAPGAADAPGRVGPPLA